MPNKLGTMGIIGGRGMSNKAFKELFYSSFDNYTIDLPDGGKLYMELGRGSGKSGIYDSNLRLIGLRFQKKVEEAKKLTDAALIDLWNNILESQRKPSANPVVSFYMGVPVYDVGTMTIKEARDKVETEMKNRGIRMNFKFLYNNYKANIKGGKKYGEFDIKLHS